MNKPFQLSDANKAKIIASIQEFEAKTSGEIKVHFDSCFDGDPYERALYIFNELALHKTKNRNAVLFYFSMATKKLAIIGDKGIHEVVPENFWNESKNIMVNAFKENRIIEGIIAGIEKAGQALTAYFPSQKDDVNEISNEISKDDEM